MAAVYNLIVSKGDDLNFRLTGLNNNGSYFNLSGYTASGFVRYRFSDSTGYIHNLEPMIHDSRISGIIDVTISGAVSDLWPTTLLRYDIELYSGSSKTRMIQGVITVDPGVTY